MPMSSTELTSHRTFVKGADHYRCRLAACYGQQLHEARQTHRREPGVPALPTNGVLFSARDNALVQTIHPHTMKDDNNGY